MQIQDEQFTKWLRRPTELIASAWFLLASAGSIIVTYAFMFLDQLLRLFSADVSIDLLIYLNSAVTEIGLFFLPVMIYALKRDGVEQSMRLKLPRWEALLAVLIAPIGVMACDKLSTWWLMLIEALGGTFSLPDHPGFNTLPELGVALIFSALIPAVCEAV